MVKGIANGIGDGIGDGNGIGIGDGIGIGNGEAKKGDQFVFSLGELFSEKKISTLLYFFSL